MDLRINSLTYNVVSDTLAFVDVPISVDYRIKCGNCKFYGLFAKMCKRFPSYVCREEDDWCGEFSPKPWGAEHDQN